MTSIIEPDPTVQASQATADLQPIHDCVGGILAKLDIPAAEIAFTLELASGKLKLVIQTKHFLEAQDLAVELGRGIQQIATDEMLELAVYKCKDATAQPYLIKEMALAKANDSDVEASTPTVNSSNRTSGSTMYQYSQQTLEQDREFGREILRQTSRKTRNLVVAKVLSAVIAVGLTVGILMLSWRTINFYRYIPLGSIDVNRLPDMGTVYSDSGYNIYRVVVPRGSRTLMTRLFIYLPNPLSNRKLPCVLIAGARSSPLYGSFEEDGGGNGSAHSMAGEYLRAGYAVISYDIDGALTGAIDESNETTQANSFAKPNELILNQLSAYKDSEAGMLNAKLAIDYAVARVKEIDPDALYIAGNEANASLALMVAANDNRIKGTIANSPIINVTNKFSDSIDTIQKILPGYRETIDRNSPHNNIAKMTKPLFISHNASNPKISKADLDAFVDAAKPTNSKIMSITVTGVKEGFDTGVSKESIEWLNAQTKK